jgi:hypothetical protein
MAGEEYKIRPELLARDIGGKAFSSRPPPKVRFVFHG